MPRQRVVYPYGYSGSMGRSTPGDLLGAGDVEEGDHSFSNRQSPIASLQPLAVHVDGDLAMLLEVKAIGLDLKDQHTKQAVDYAANKGCD